MAKRERFTLNIDGESIATIDAIAQKNCLSRSAVLRMILHMLVDLPADYLEEVSPLGKFLKDGAYAR